MIYFMPVLLVSMAKGYADVLCNNRGKGERRRGTFLYVRIRQFKNYSYYVPVKEHIVYFYNILKNIRIVFMYLDVLNFSFISYSCFH